MTDQLTIPEGYMMDAAGNMRPKTNIREIDLLRDDITRKLFALGEEVARKAAEYKQMAFDEISAFVDLSHEKYNVKRGGKKGNVTLTSYDGEYKIELARQENIQFTEELAAAQELILQCLDEWTTESRPEVRMIIDEAFRTNKQGQVSTTKVLGLLRLDIKESKWATAMDAIRDSIKVSGSAAYIRLYRRKPGTDQYENVSLDGTAALRAATTEEAS